tara:strand:+ start:211 stop:426 length:216 start_codon:yes stop_codon:yes gene_type:complete
LIELTSKKFNKLLKIRKILLIKNKTLYFSLKKLSESLLKFIMVEINKNKIPIDKVEGKRNNPIKKNISPTS